MSLVVFAGCGLQASTANRLGDADSSAADAGPITIEAGVVLADRDGYLCLPLEQVGLPPEASAVAAESSCECVQPRIVEYVNTAQEPAQAIWLQYVEEAGASESGSNRSGTAGAALTAGEVESRPANLGVLIDLQLEDGTTHQFTVNLLHTRLAEEVLP